MFSCRRAVLARSRARFLIFAVVPVNENKTQLAHGSSFVPLSRAVTAPDDVAPLSLRDVHALASWVEEDRAMPVGKDEW